MDDGWFRDVVQKLMNTARSQNQGGWSPILAVQTPRLTKVMSSSRAHQPLFFNTMAEPSWQETLRLRLVERNNRDSAFASIIEQCSWPSFSVRF